MLFRLARIEYATWIVVALGLVTASVLLVGARNISPPIFDPVGSAAVPRACAFALLGCATGVFIQNWLAAGVEQEPSTKDPVRFATIFVAALMVLCLLAMNLGLGFTFTTILFTALSVPVVSGTMRSIPIAIGLALVLGFGAEWLFTSVFFVDLPRFG